MKAILPVLAALALCAGTRANEASNPAWGKAADNRIYAQKLVNEVMAAHPELVVVGIHPVAPGATSGVMIASNLDRIGKADDDDDIGTATEHKTVLAPNLNEPTKFEVLIPLKDASGDFIGALGLVFRYHAGQDERALLDDALSIRDGLASKVHSIAELSKPAEL